MLTHNTIQFSQQILPSPFHSHDEARYFAVRAGSGTAYHVYANDVHAIFHRLLLTV